MGRGPPLLIGLPHESVCTVMAKSTVISVAAKTLKSNMFLHSLTKSSFSGSYRVLTQLLKAPLKPSPPLVPPTASKYPYQKKAYIGSLMRSFGSHSAG